MPGASPELFLGLESVAFASEERKLRWMALLSHSRTAWAVNERLLKAFTARYVLDASIQHACRALQRRQLGDTSGPRLG